MQPRITDKLSMAKMYLPEHITNPYPLFHQIRAIDHVYWDEDMGEAGAWMLTGYDVVIAALHDYRLSAIRPSWNTDHLHKERHTALAAPMRVLSMAIFASDPPTHTRIRSLMSKTFTPRVVEKVRLDIEQIASTLLNAVQDKKQMDVVRDFAYVLPSTVIAKMLGLPAKDRGLFFKWILSFGRLLDGGMMTDQDTEQCLLHVAAFMDYFRGVIRQRRTHPQDDLWQSLLNAYEAGEFLNEEELLSMLIFLVVAGQITTTHQIGNSILALLRFPEQYQLLKNNPSLLSLAAQEFLRYDCAVQVVRRWVKEPLEVGGKHLREGEEIFAWLAAANRDPARFSNPDFLDIQRKDNRGLAFGYGIHYCLGAPLGKLILEIGLGLFLERIRSPKVDLEHIVRTTVPMFRGVHVFPIMFD